MQCISVLTVVSYYFFFFLPNLEGYISSSVTRIATRVYLRVRNVVAAPRNASRRLPTEPAVESVQFTSARVDSSWGGDSSGGGGGLIDDNDYVLLNANNRRRSTTKDTRCTRREGPAVTMFNNTVVVVRLRFTIVFNR